MSNVMTYKNYLGSVEFSEADRLFYGKVQGVRALISYEGETVEELLDDFHEAVDDYLNLCKVEGKVPESASATPRQIIRLPFIAKPSLKKSR